MGIPSFAGLSGTLYAAMAVGMTFFKFGFIGLTPDELQVKHSRWSREARLVGELRWKSFGFPH
jgi:hypothetical protein